jgi:hypothetical protein
MKTPQLVTKDKLHALRTLAEQAASPKEPLRGQGEVAKILQSKGYSAHGISRFLTEHGIPVSRNAVRRFLSQTIESPTNQS